jgi:hypothetical protein
MTVLTSDFLNLFPVMAVCATLLKCLSVIFTGGMAIGTLQSIACHMGFMRKFDIVEGNGAFFHPHMTEGGTGHLGLKFFGFVTLLENPKGLLCLIIGCVEEFEGIFDIMSALAQKDKAIIMSGFVEEVLGLFKLLRSSSGFFKLI